MFTAHATAPRHRAGGEGKGTEHMMSNRDWRTLARCPFCGAERESLWPPVATTHAASAATSRAVIGHGSIVVGERGHVERHVDLDAAWRERGCHLAAR